MFDNDYDVLYANSRNVSAFNGKTLYELIAAHATSKEHFDELFAQLPLLTIYIPQLDNFNAEKWNIDTQIPIVAVRNTTDQKNGKPLLAYDAKGNEIALNYATKPDHPVIVVKENERVTVNTSSVESGINRQNGNNTFLHADGKNFSFIDESYNGLKRTAGIERIGTIDPGPRGNQNALLVDPRVVAAYDKGVTPQRDYIYYGIDPAQGVNSGPFNTSYAEFITNIKVNEYSSKSYIVDDDFTDGMLEFQVTIFFIQNTGAAGSILKVFPCDPNNLFKTDGRILLPDGTIKTTYTVDYTLPSPIQITDWDMQKYGNTWKVLIMEYDPGTEITKSTSIGSTFGTNFGFDIGLGTTVKLGLKFGGTSTTTTTTTVNYKVTGTSDNLGEALLDYSAPILTGKTDYRGTITGPIYGINTGTVTLDIETRKRY